MIYVIGIGLAGMDGLSPATLEIIRSAGLITAGQRHLELVKGHTAKKIALNNGLEKAAVAISGYLKKHPRKNVAVLATGDPLLFGIGGFIIKRFGKKRVEIIQAVSMAQEAFAKIKENSTGMKVFSVHGKTASLEKIAKVAGEIIGFEKAAVFTDPVNTPAKVCAALIVAKATGYTAFVCESLGLEDEKITKGTLTAVAKRKAFAPLSTLLLVRSKKTGQARPRACFQPFGIPDALFSRSNGLITKEELRVISLAKLRLGIDSVVWDIGAGSGSVATEAGRLALSGRVIAIEKDPARIKDVEKNIKRFGVRNVDVVKGFAPACLKGLPAPDAVFIGGGGSGIIAILKAASKQLKKSGRIVVNAVTVETVGRATQYFKENNWDWETILISLAKSRSVGDLSMLKANNPVFIITGIKP
jgi:precorrin-6Y C5,15-methyltransferase (decarboxylating)